MTASREASVTVVPYPDGPLIVRGDFALEDVDGTPIGQGGSAVALCRCGKSAVKPFCDGTHKLVARTHKKDSSPATPSAPTRADQN
jgi:CDGSH-type Zn-finger protein